MVMKSLQSRSMSKHDKRLFDVQPDDFADQQSIDGASSTASFDRFCADVLGEGPLMDGPCDPFWDADESTTSTSVDSSPLGWPSSAMEMSRLAKLHSLSRTVNNRQAAEREEKEKKAEVFSDVSEVHLMKERFAKLLLGEDLSGGGKGVSSALAISNAITNLSASKFGELYRVEPLSQERKARWRRERGWLLSVCDHIVEFVPHHRHQEMALLWRREKFYKYEGCVLMRVDVTRMVVNWRSVDFANLKTFTNACGQSGLK